MLGRGNDGQERWTLKTIFFVKFQGCLCYNISRWRMDFGFFILSEVNCTWNYQSYAPNSTECINGTLYVCENGYFNETYTTCGKCIVHVHMVISIFTNYGYLCVQLTTFDLFILRE